jgi:tetratricopeptide (TPR) repeat protein
MQPKSVKEVSQRVKGFYQKAQDAAGQRNVEYSIEMYNTALKLCPEFRDARLELRKIELIKIKNKASGTRQAWITTKNTLALNVKGPGLIKKGEYSQAFEIAESILAQDPMIPTALKLLATAAEEASMDWLAIDTLEFHLKYHNKDSSSMMKIFQLYLDNGRGDDAVIICNKLQNLDPNNGEFQSMLKNALARQAMDKSSWMADNKSTDDAEENKEGEEEPAGMGTRRPQRDAAPRDQDSADALVSKYVQQIETGNDSVDIRKKLARALTKALRFDEAIEQLDHCIQNGQHTDPGIQNMMFQAVDTRFEVAIKAWEDYGNKGDDKEKQAYSEIAVLEQQRSDYRLLRARERALMYSNDPNVHMELAMCLWEQQEIDEALIEFQKAQGSARHRKSATMHKGKCFALKEQYDIAITEFELLLSEIQEMSKEKLDVIYELASALRSVGRIEDSMAQFKLIYLEDVAYRDIQEIMDQFYKKE